MGLRLAGDTLTQLTFDPGTDGFPVWTPDGKRIAFGSDRAKPGGPRNLYWVNADGTGEVTRLTDSPDDRFRFRGIRVAGSSRSPQTAPATGYDLMILPMDGDAAKGWKPGTPTVFLGTPAQEVGPMFSPDGRFVAYSWPHARAGVRWEVFVRPFPGPGGQWRVSDNGGMYPRWSATTHELLWVSSGTQKAEVLFAPFSIAGDAFVPGKPQLWSPSELLWRSTNSHWDVHPDGKRVAAEAAFVQTQTTIQDHVVIMSNFFEYLRAIAPVKK